MEALLQEALDEFDDDPPPASSSEAMTAPQLQPSPPAAPAPVPAPASPATSEPVLDSETDELARQLMEGLNMSGDGNGADDMEQTLKALARSAETLAHDSPNGDGPNPMELLKQMGLGDMSGLVGAGGTSDGAGGEQLDGLLDGLVGQLLSKEVMLEPMQHLHAELPRYLSEKGDSLSPADLQRFRKQEQIIGQILSAYDEEPSDPDKVAALMQEMQQCGPPPPEIAGPIAGLEGLSGGCVVS